MHKLHKLQTLHDLHLLFFRPTTLWTQTTVMMAALSFLTFQEMSMSMCLLNVVERWITMSPLNVVAMSFVILWRLRLLMGLWVRTGLLMLKGTICLRIW